MTDDVAAAAGGAHQSRRSDSARKVLHAPAARRGPERCAKKLGEEAIETVIAALASDSARSLRRKRPTSSIICWCCSRAARALDDVLAELDAHGHLGPAEKAERGTKPQIERRKHVGCPT